MADLASRLLVLVVIAFVAWVWLLVLFRRIAEPAAGVLAAPVNVVGGQAFRVVAPAEMRERAASDV